MNDENTSLLFPLASLKHGRNRFPVELDPESLDLEAYDFIEPLRCLIILDRSSKRVEVRLDISTSLKMTCSKCLEPASVPIRDSWRVTYLPESERKEAATEEQMEPTDLEYYHDDIDLRPVVRDVFMLSVPIAPLCKPDCLGLCPKCGVNRNLIECDCDTGIKPSPFEKLRRLVDE